MTSDNQESESETDNENVKQPPEETTEGILDKKEEALADMSNSRPQGK